MNDRDPLPGSRYTDVPLPSYRHRPGRTPHPTRDPAGHSHAAGRIYAGPLPDLNTVAPPASEAFLYGLDLFNAGYWWESHDVLEGLWNAAGHATPAGHLLQALIQCCAAHLKARAGQQAAARKLLRQAVRNLDRGGGLDLGLDLAGLLAATAGYIQDPGRGPARLLLRQDPAPG